MYLKQSTASQTVVIGPFVDSADGNTIKDLLTIDAADIRLSKNGGNIVAKNSGGGTHDELGYYTITLDATDTDTVGRLQLMVHESGALPVYHEFQVLEEAVYDDLFAASAVGYPTAAEVVNEWESQSQADPTGFHVNVLEVNGTAQTANDNGADINAILADTNELQTDWVDGGRLDLILDAILDDTDLIDDGTSGLAKIATDAAAILVDTSTTLQNELDGIQADTEDIQSRLPAALVGGRIDATVDATGMESGAVDAIWDEVLEGSYTARQLMRAFAAALAGKVSGAGTTTITFRNTGDSKDVITATVDVNGNRSEVTLDLT